MKIQGSKLRLVRVVYVSYSNSIHEYNHRVLSQNARAFGGLFGEPLLVPDSLSIIVVLNLRVVIIPINTRGKTQF